MPGVTLMHRVTREKQAVHMHTAGIVPYLWRQLPDRTVPEIGESGCTWMEHGEEEGHSWP